MMDLSGFGDRVPVSLFATQDEASFLGIMVLHF